MNYAILIESSTFLILKRLKKRRAGRPTRDYFYTNDPDRATTFNSRIVAERNVKKYIKYYGLDSPMPEGYEENDIRVIDEDELLVHSIMQS